MPDGRDTFFVCGRDFDWTGLSCALRGDESMRISSTAWRAIGVFERLQYPNRFLLSRVDFFCNPRVGRVSWSHV